MIEIKNSQQLALMKEAGRITGEALYKAGEAVKPGISTKKLDDIVRHHIEKCGATPSFLGYNGFPASACISVNDEVIHGIPSNNRILAEGDIVKIDVGAFYKGFHGDSANTFAVGNISNEIQRLIDVTKKSFYIGLEQFAQGKRTGDLGNAIESFVVQNGYNVVKVYTGHGVGHHLHEEPDVPNYGTIGRGARFCYGMTIAIEPMVIMGGSAIRVLDNDWTVVSRDGTMAAHYEHTAALTPDGVILLTKVD